MKNRTAVALVLSLAATTAGLQVRAEEAPARPPLRGAYIHLDRLIAGKGEPEGRAAIGRLLDRGKLTGLKSVLPFANASNGKTLWPSRVATAAVQGWNPLAVLAEEARRRDLAFEPVVCMLISGHDAPAGVLVKHPEWALRQPKGGPLGYISAANPEARAWVNALIAELVRDLQPDALWFDYLRFPSQAVELDPTGAKALEEALTGVPEADRKARTQQFREDALTGLARELSATARTARPGLRLGIYSWGPQVASGHRVAQAWPKWLDERLIDVVNVSGYCYRENYQDRFMDEFRKRLKEAVNLAEGRGEITFALGIKTSHGAVRNAGEILDYQRAAAELGIDGYSYFTLNTLDAYIDEIKVAETP